MARRMTTSHLTARLKVLDGTGFNRVHLADLRMACPELSRAEFDALCQQARAEKRIRLSSSMDSEDISARDENAAIRGGSGCLLIYASVVNTKE